MSSRSIILVDVDLPQRSPSSRPPRACFRLSPSQQAYVDAHAPPSLGAEESRLPVGKAVRVESEGKELARGLMEARKVAARLKRLERQGQRPSWQSSGAFGESLEDVTAGAEAFLLGACNE
eukprot:152559-Hanusia_phi.AAC.1